MSDHRAVRFLFFLIFTSCSPFLLGYPGVLAARNVTIDDRDPTIIYSPPESWTHVSDLRFPVFVNSTYTWVDDPNAIATFNFTGIAIYFLHAWVGGFVIPGARSMDANNTVSLDSSPPTLLDYSTLNPVASQGIVWYATGLENKQHTLRISPRAVDPFLIVDALLYTVLSDTPSPITSVSPPASSSSSSSATSTQTNQGVAHSALNPSSSASPKRAIAIALGTTFGILGLLIIPFAIWHSRRKRQQPVSVGADTSGGFRDWLTRLRAVGGGEGGGFLRALGISRKRTEYDPRYDGRASSPTQTRASQQMHQMPEAENATPRYNIVEAPLPPVPLTSPQTPGHSYTYQNENGHSHPQSYSHRPLPPPLIVDPGTPGPNQREASIALSSTTEGQTPHMPGSGRAWDEAFAPNFT